MSVFIYIQDKHQLYLEIAIYKSDFKFQSIWSFNIQFEKFLVTTVALITVVTLSI